MNAFEIEESKRLLEERIHEIDDRIEKIVSSDDPAISRLSSFQNQMILREAYISSYKSLFLLAVFQLNCRENVNE